ncbi:hypothetical protein MARCHEWKA_00750 [Brevundimonas phage vB_BpoS-Marchewka]|uniref:Uncharacterized protein n=1 Tax=Brevundimonas phage vB_BpoS-Marchewka TaxID=2948604 RepID=A0A9E7N4D4_9CAUD|nr:hypothetical protein MARCHEWKA_00750 [Brevundimonas phage vB_BpoS-Marchewka]
MSRQTERKPRPDAEQSPVRPTRINPDMEARRAKAAGAMTSRDYIARFTQADTAPEPDGEARDAQIVAMCRRLLPAQTKKATDAQVMGLHRAFMSGRL